MGRSRRRASPSSDSNPSRTTSSSRPIATESNSDVMQQMRSGSGSSKDAPALQGVLDLLLSGQQSAARDEARRVAQQAREKGDPTTASLAGELWQLSQAVTTARDAMASSDWSGAKSAARNAASLARGLRGTSGLRADSLDRVITAAGGYWNKANQAEKEASGPGGLNGTGEVGPYAVWTTGGGSHELPREGWDSSDFRRHHTDRTNSPAADRVRAGTNVPYDAVEAYDFTFEKADRNGKGIPGTAHGLPLMTPVKSKVYDIEPAMSSGYGLFIVLEYLEGDLAGQRVAIHHLDSVQPFTRGQEIPGGIVFGTQGATGKARFEFDTHIDIVGTAEAVALFVQSNQSGKFQTQVKPPTANEIN